MIAKVILGLSSSLLLFSGVAFAIPGTCTINGSITGTYQTASNQPIDTFNASLSATFLQYNGAPAGGYATGYPRQKFKYYDASGNPFNGDEPGTLSPSPDVFGGGGAGSVSLSSQGSLDSFGPLYLDGTPYGTHSLIRHWKLLGYAGSQQAQASAECNVLAPSYNQISF